MQAAVIIRNVNLQAPFPQEFCALKSAAPEKLSNEPVEKGNDSIVVTAIPIVNMSHGISQFYITAASVIILMSKNVSPRTGGNIMPVPIVNRPTNHWKKR